MCLKAAKNDFDSNNFHFYFNLLIIWKRIRIFLDLNTRIYVVLWTSSKPWISNVAPVVVICVLSSHGPGSCCSSICSTLQYFLSWHGAYDKNQQKPPLASTDNNIRFFPFKLAMELLKRSHSKHQNVLSLQLIKSNEDSWCISTSPRLARNMQC